MYYFLSPDSSSTCINLGIIDKHKQGSFVLFKNPNFYLKAYLYLSGTIILRNTVSIKTLNYDVRELSE